MEKVCNLTISEDKFQEPRKKFWTRSRKRPKSDAMSVCSMDISIDSVGKQKKRRKISQVASSLFLPNRSVDGRNANSDVSFIESGALSTKKKIRVSNEAAGNVPLRSWMLDVAELGIASTLSRREIKRQEAIYELFCGENVLLNDLCILRDFYYQPLSVTNIFTPDELTTLFGDISKFIEVHGNLRDEMVELRDRSGYIDCVGPTMVDWLAQLTDIYVSRCKSQVWARHILESKKASCKRFQDFLKKRTEALRSVDLWTYLDIPRSRIVKYPLLVNEILRHTAANHVDEAALKRAGEVLSELLRKIDRGMGDANCQLAKNKINPRPEHDPTNCIENAAELITEGFLKDIRGMKYYCFLFNTCFVLTRLSRRPGRKYNISFPVIPQEDVCIQIVTPNKSTASFKVGDHILVSEDEHHRRHWFDSFKRITMTRIDVARRRQNIGITDEKEKENKPEIDSVPVTPETSRRSPRNSLRDSYFSLSLRKTLLRQRKNSIDNT